MFLVGPVGLLCLALPLWESVRTHSIWSTAGAVLSGFLGGELSLDWHAIRTVRWPPYREFTFVFVAVRCVELELADGRITPLSSTVNISGKSVKRVRELHAQSGTEHSLDEPLTCATKNRGKVVRRFGFVEAASAVLDVTT